MRQKQGTSLLLVLTFAHTHTQIKNSLRSYLDHFPCEKQAFGRVMV